MFIVEPHLPYNQFNALTNNDVIFQKAAIMSLSVLVKGRYFFIYLGKIRSD